MATMRRRTTAGESTAQAPFPLNDPLATLPPTAQVILKAARDLLTESGYRAITYQNVAAAANVDKGSISYNFGNKAGLVAAVVDSLVHDECLALVEEAEQFTGEDRIRHMVDGLKRITLAADAQRGWFDILPYAMRDADLQSRMHALYGWFFAVNLRWLGLDPETCRDDPYAQGLAAVIAAATDGLAIQVGLGAQSDLDDAFAVFEVMLRAAAAEMSGRTL
jgi:AcrR family transcriptional regulator